MCLLGRVPRSHHPGILSALFFARKARVSDGVSKTSSSSSGNLRAGVIGAGPFGRLHAQKYASLQGVQLAGIFDRDPAAAGALAAAHGTLAFESLQSLFDAVDLVTIATPATTHGSLARDALRAGKHVLVEKPIATTLEDADAIIAMAQARGLQLQAGHQERVVMAAAGILGRTQRPRRIECVRAGPFTGRALDVSVVLDLMIHDLDLLHCLADGEVVAVRARQSAGPGTASDEVEAFLQLSSGTDVRLLASRMAPERKRTMRLEYADGVIAIDFLTRTVENATPDRLPPLFTNGAPSSPEAADPLGTAIARFIAAVRGEGTVLAPASDARRALDSALRILNAASIVAPEPIHAS